MDTFEKLNEILSHRIMVIDGAMGTMIQKYKLTEEDYRGARFKDYPRSVKGNNDLLSLTRPEVIEEIHRKFLEAGADIIETNTFNCNAISMLDYGMENLIAELNTAAAGIARKAADEMTLLTPEKPRFVAGAIGPTTRSASLSPDVNNPGFRSVDFQELVKVYSEQAVALIDGGVDIILIETVFDTLNCKAALFAVNTLFDERNIKLPVMVSGTITDASGRTLSGQTPEAFYISVQHADLFSIGLNCALGAAQMRPFIHEIATVAECKVSCYPNAGLPNEFGEYDESPEHMAKVIEDFAKSGFLNIVGGCCGTTPDHIRAIAKTVEKYSPRALPVTVS